MKNSTLNLTLKFDTKSMCCHKVLRSALILPTFSKIGQGQDLCWKLKGQSNFSTGEQKFFRAKTMEDVMETMFLLEGRKQAVSILRTWLFSLFVHKLLPR